MWTWLIDNIYWIIGIAAIIIVGVWASVYATFKRAAEDSPEAKVELDRVYNPIKEKMKKLLKP